MFVLTSIWEVFMKRLFIVVLYFLLTSMVLAQGHFEKSLHYTRQGKATFYMGTESQPGLYALTGIPIGNLACQKCHADTLATGETVDPANYEPGCQDCHKSDFSVPKQVCSGCHGRIKKQQAKGITDIHQTDYGLWCSDCHEKQDFHGPDDGTAYISMLEPGAMTAECTNCHSGENAPPENPSHKQHINDIHCATCHTKQVISCYNCHFNSLLDEHVKRANTFLSNFMIIAHRSKDNKIYPITFQSVVYKTPDGRDSCFVTMVPYYSHNVVKAEEAKRCEDCHANANVQAYNDNGSIILTKWNDSENKIEVAPGVIPLTQDWTTSLKMEFLMYDTTTATWSPINKKNADLVQNLGYVIPLTDEEMQKLSVVQALDGNKQMIKSFTLMQNYPNPFNPVTSIPFTLDKQSKVTLQIFDGTGRFVTFILKNVPMAAGYHEINFNGDKLASGVYFYTIRADNHIQTKKMVLMK